MFFGKGLSMAEKKKAKKGDDSVSYSQRVSKKGNRSGPRIRFTPRGLSRNSNSRTI